jgi:hypothetical protein
MRRIGALGWRRVGGRHEHDQEGQDHPRLRIVVTSLSDHYQKVSAPRRTNFLISTS